MRKDPTLQGWRRWTLVVLLALVSLSALAAGYGFMGRPDGTALGIPRAWLDGTPFPDYFVPGALLFALGLLYGGAAFVEARRLRGAWFWAGLSGGAMVVWILVQVALMGYDRHPIQTALQGIVMSIGLVVGVIAWSQLRDARRSRHAARA